MSDESKTREELLEELRALRAQVQQGQPETNDDPEPASAPQEGMTRRQALESAAWVAPVILSVSLSGTPAEAQGQPRHKPQGQRGPFAPTPAPVPTPAPTSFPTCSPTNTMCPTPFVPVELQSFKID